MEPFPVKPKEIHGRTYVCLLDEDHYPEMASW